MAETIDARQWVEIVQVMSLAIQAQADHLSALDSTVGDGDHGVSLAKAMTAAGQQVVELDSPTPASVMRTVGEIIQNQMGGTSGIIFGAFFLGLADAFDGHREINTIQVAAGLTAGLAQVQKRGKAEPGGKTMVDALAPAAEAVTQAAEQNASMATTLRRAAEAAQAGAEATRGMVARYGRAKFLGERSLGHQDAGATSMAILLATWADTFGD